MVDMRVRLDPKTSSKSKSMRSARARRRTLFGEPLLLEGEDGAAYDELLARVWAAVNPADILDEMFTVEVVSLEWEVLRWRRLKLSLIRARATAALEEFLREELDYNLYSEYFAGDLTEILQDNLPEDQAGFAQHWPTNVPGIKRMLSTRSIRFSMVLDCTWTTYWTVRGTAG
jgi:hypothetical protein